MTIPLWCPIHQKFHGAEMPEEPKPVEMVYEATWGRPIKRSAGLEPRQMRRHNGRFAGTAWVEPPRISVMT